MSIDRAYIRRSLVGAFRLGMRDPRGLSAFDLTMDGFFRSFYAVLLAAPIYAFTAFGAMRIIQAMPRTAEMDGKEASSLLIFVLFHVANYVGSAVIFLIAMVPITRFMGAGQRFATLVIAYNWGTLLVHALFVPPVLLFALGILPAVDAQALNLILTGFVIYFRFALIRAALDTPWQDAIALALIERLLVLLWFLLLLQLV